MNPCELVTLTVWASTDPKEGAAATSTVMTHYRGLNTLIGLLDQGQTSGMLEGAANDETLLIWCGRELSGHAGHVNLVTSLARTTEQNTLGR